MKIFITGGSGFIGSYLTQVLLKNNHDVATFDANLSFINNPAYYKMSLDLRNSHFTLRPNKQYRGDIRNKLVLEKAVNEFKPEVLIHLAGLPMARAPENHAHKMVDINLDGTINVLDVFEQTSSLRRIIYTSSSMSYGHFTKNPQPEMSILNPVNCYGATKAAGEYFVKLSKKEWVILRPTSIYGFSDCANRVTQLLIDAAILGKKAWVVKGESLDFTYVEDVAAGFARCATSKKAAFQTFNISRGESRPASAFAEELVKYFPKFEFEIRQPNTTQVWRGAMDNSKIKSILGFECSTSIEKGIGKTIKLMKKYHQLDMINKILK